MRRMGIGIGTLLLTVFAAAFALCPLSAWFAAREQNAQILSRLEAQVQAMDAQALKRRENVAKWYNLSFRSQDLTQAYAQVLDFGGGVMGALEIPGLGMYLPVSAAGGAGVTHDAATALPTGGRGNTAALLGLGDISELHQGDLVYLHILGEIHVYQAGGEGSDRLVLYGKNRTGQALSVTCTRLYDAPAQAEAPKDAAPAAKAAVWTALGAGAGLGAWCIFAKYLEIVRKRRDKSGVLAENRGKIPL